jgi:hypothetical protein
VCEGALEGDPSSLILSLIAKTAANSSGQARRQALELVDELRSGIPYDYHVWPATSRDGFHRLAGWHILKGCRSARSLAHLRRLETPYHWNGETIFLLGSWHTSIRADEQIWRTLAGLRYPALMNVTLRPTQINDRERQALAELLEQASRLAQTVKEPVHMPYLNWAKAGLENRLAQAVRPYKLQVHFASPDGIPEYLLRAVGTSLTRDLTQNPVVPTFDTLVPESDDQAAGWLPYIYWLEMLPLNPLGSLTPNLRDLAAAKEAHAVIRLPFPPPGGLPGVNFLSQEDHGKNTANG